MQGIAQKVLADPGRYSIQQLQQAVQDGIIPAYIAIPIIQSKVQEQKQAQMAQTMQQPPAQARPPVAQQVMSEARGLEALPTNLPTQYAGGGIVAFDEGGEVPRFQVGGMPRYETPYDRMNRLNREREAQEAAAREAQAQELGIMPYGQQMSNLGGALLNAPGAALRYLTSAPGGPGLLNFSTAPTTSTQPTDAAQPTGTAPTQPTPGQTALATAPSTGAGITGLGGAQSATVTPGLGLKQPKLAVPEGDSYEAGAKKFYEGYEKKAEALDAETDKAIKDANEAVKGKAFEGYKQALEKEALEAGAEKDQAKYMSIFKAGLAMMAGTSRHAFENIGKGAMVGAEDYQAAVKDLKKAEKERQKEFAYIEQAQRAEAIGDRDKAVDRLDRARDRRDKRLQYIGEGIYKATNLDKAQAYDVAKTQFSSDTDVFRTHLAGQYQLGAAGISADARMAALLASSAGRGQMNQKQVGDALIQLQSSPEAIEYKKKLIEQKGKNAVNTPEFKAAMDNFVGGLFQKYYGGATRGGTGTGGGINIGQDDMDLIQRYLGR